MSSMSKMPICEMVLIAKSGDASQLCVDRDSFVKMLDEYAKHEDNANLIEALISLTEDLNLTPDRVGKLVDKHTHDRLECVAAELNLLKFKPRTRRLTG